MRRLGALVAIAALLVANGCGAGKDDRDGPPVTRDPVGPSTVVSMQDDRIPGAPGQFTAKQIDERVKLMANLGASVIRVNLQWDVAAPQRPASPRDPADPVYRWEGPDAVVEAAEANGVEVLFTVWGTPTWARDSTVQNTAPWGNARPANASDFGDFAAAAARRYFPRGVRKWEAWNEPNNPLFLQPQFERRGERWFAVSPGIYAELLTAFSAEVKAVDANAVIGGGVMAPAGDDPTRPNRRPNRVRPDQFLRALDALDDPPSMDVVSHHPYPIRVPTDTRGPNFIDLYNLDRLFTTIDATYLRGKPVWLTEYGFSTEAVDAYPLFFTPDEQATLIADAFALTRRTRRIQLATYFHLQDNPQWKSGIIGLDDQPKPGRDAFAMPLVNAGAAGSGGVRLVGQVRATKATTTVTLERRVGDSWTAILEAPTTSDGTFAAVVGPGDAAEIRAKWTGTARSGDRVTWTSRPLSLPERP